MEYDRTVNEPIKLNIDGEFEIVLLGTSFYDALLSIIEKGFLLME